MNSIQMHELIPLNRLRTGRIAQVAEVVGRPEQVQRIHELGLRDGAEVQMVRSGSPCIIRLAGHTLCFRPNDLLSVFVRTGVTA